MFTIKILSEESDWEDQSYTGDYSGSSGNNDNIARNKLVSVLKKLEAGCNTFDKVAANNIKNNNNKQKNNKKKNNNNNDDDGDVVDKDDGGRGDEDGIRGDNDGNRGSGDDE